MMSEGTSSRTVSPSSSDLASQRSQGKMVVSEPYFTTFKHDSEHVSALTLILISDLIVSKILAFQPFLSLTVVLFPLCRDASRGSSLCYRVRFVSSPRCLLRLPAPKKHNSQTESSDSCAE